MAAAKKTGKAGAKAAGISLVPLDDRVVVERLEAEEKTSGGIVLPDAAKEKPQRGKVLAVGPGRRLETGKRKACDVKAGDVVLLAKVE